MQENKPRLLYMDNIKLLMIILVVIMHLAVTYSGKGSWYYTEGSSVDFPSEVFFWVYEGFTQAYFMGLMFLIAGFFTPKAYDKKGCCLFLKQRFIRLCVPALLYMFIIQPFILFFELGVYWVYPKPDFFSFYAKYITDLSFIGGTGPLWFVVALFFFSLTYALIRSATDRKPNRPSRAIKVCLKNELLLIVLIATGAFLIRIIQPIGTSVVNMQLCYFSSYIFLFIVGIAAGRYELVEQITLRHGMFWLYAVSGASVLLITPLAIFGGLFSGDSSFFGGVTWQAAVYALWESFIAVGMSIFFIAYFKSSHNRQNKLTKMLSDNSFAVYMFHAPVIIAAAILIHPLPMIPILKFVLLIITSIPICFLLTHFVLRKIPFLKRVI